jgi:hypothetical protein
MPEDEQTHCNPKPTAAYDQTARNGNRATGNQALAAKCGSTLQRCILKHVII